MNLPVKLLLLSVVIALTHESALAKPHKAVPKKASQSCQTAGALKLPPSAELDVTEDGGFAARHNVYRAPMKKLHPELQRQLCALVTSSGLLKETDKKNTNPAAADAITYTFQLTTGGQTHKAAFDDTTLPEDYRKMLDLIKKSGLTPERSRP